MIPSVRGKLCGEHSKALILNSKKSKRVEKLSQLIKFFNQQDGDQEFCNMLSIIAGEGPSSETAS